MACVSHEIISARAQQALEIHAARRRMPAVVLAPEHKHLVLNRQKPFRYCFQIKIAQRVHNRFARKPVGNRFVILLDDMVVDQLRVGNALLQQFSNVARGIEVPRKHRNQRFLHVMDELRHLLGDSAGGNGNAVGNAFGIERQKAEHVDRAQ
ncbi:hypothetical protein SDC9_65786 [bioreactor metagenome]|uniref:Uncharacterized protein n=1 Tax=bioreactor metagenome TaxID=1076179 RepID=A0A644XYK5_9ZZZZ